MIAWLAVLFAGPGVLAAAWLRFQNPWFLDAPGLYLLLAVLVPAGVGALLGWGLARVTGRRSLGGSLLYGVVALEALLYAIVALTPTPRLDSVQVLVLGVDGATFDVIDPLVERGELPAFERLGREGSRARLRATDPLFSPLLWTTMATGKPPEEHGVMGFHVQSHFARVPRFWDIAEREGKRVGIYKWLVTWPPREVEGFMVPAWLAPEPDTWPTRLSWIKELELANRLKRKSKQATRATTELLVAGLEGGLRFSTLVEAASWKLRETVSRPDEPTRRVALERMRVHIDRDAFVHAAWRERPELATLTLYATDALGHTFWRAFEPGAFADVDPAEVARFGQVVPDAYRQADAVLGELLSALPDNAMLLLVSDHGFQALKAGTGNKSFFTPTTERLRERLSEVVGPVDVSKLGYKLAVTLTRDDQELDALAAALGTMLDDATGVPFYRWEDVPDQPRALGLTLADETVDQERIDRGTVAGDPMALYVRLTDDYSGDHTHHGVLYARGPGIEPGGRLREAHILDVAPTVLGLLGIAPAQDLTGSALFGAPPGGPPSYDALARGLYPTPEELHGGGAVSNEEALKALGYIDDGADSPRPTPPPGGRGGCAVPLAGGAWLLPALAAWARRRRTACAC